MNIYIQFKLNTTKTKGINKKTNLKAHIENRNFVEIKKKKRENQNKVIKKTKKHTLHIHYIYIHMI